jgi:two-component system OmpR family response regulator
MTEDAMPVPANDYVVLAPANETLLAALTDGSFEIGVRVATGARETLRVASAPRTRCVVLAPGTDFDQEAMCRALRLEGMLGPLLALVAEKSSEHDRRLLAAGADHVLYVEDIERIRLRLQGAIRRARGRVASCVRCGPIRLDLERGQARAGGVWLDLSSYDLELLAVLCRYPGVPLSLEELGSELLARRPSRSDRKALVQRLTRLRRKLGTFGHLVETRGGAYLLRDTSEPAPPLAHATPLDFRATRGEEASGTT